MRAMDCDCGEHLEAEDDDGLLGKVRDHVATTHPEMGANDEQLRELVASKVHDA